MIESWFTPENPHFLIFTIFCGITAALILFYLILFGRLAFYRKKELADYDEAVSVVICARNEHDNLRENLPMILEQDYPNFEVVVVNDASDDDTYFLLKVMSEQYKNLKVVNLVKEVNFFRGKKFPLSIGIKSATHDIILLTDADCVPASNRWIREMTRPYQNKDINIVLGYGAYSVKPGFLSKLIQYETISTAIMYFSMARAGKPYMGVGRNLSYRKSLFYSNKGFISHYNIASGDDDLFINKVANRNNCAFVVDSSSHTTSEPKTTFEGWFYQKRRHLSTGKHYKFRHKFVLSGYLFLQYAFFLLFAALLLLSYPYQALLIVFAVKMIVYLFIFKKSMSKLNERKLLLFSPLFELVLLILYPTIILANTFGKQNKWR